MISQDNQRTYPRQEKGGDLQTLRYNNMRLLLSSIWNYSPISRFEMARLTGLAPSSITRLIQELSQLGLVREVGKGESSGGRQPALIVPNPDAGLVISLDLSGANLRAGIFDAANHLLSAIEQPFKEIGPEMIGQQVLDITAHLLDDPAAQNRKLLGIGVSAPGTVDHENDLIINSFNLRLNNFPLGRILYENFQLPVYIEHDATVAAVAEQYYGAGRGRLNFIYVLVSTGIGSGIILDGSIYYGETGKRGEFGHIILNREGHMCACGKRGCLEAEAAAPAMIASARQILYRDKILSNLSDNQPDKVTIGNITEAAKLGDPLAMDILVNTTDYLAQGMCIFAGLFDIHLFIVGGEVAETGDIFFTQLVRSLEKFRRSNLEIEVVPAQLKKNAFLRGISMLTLQEVLSSYLEI